MGVHILDKKGYFILGTVIALLVIAALGVGLSNYFSQGQLLRINQIQTPKASYLAKVGIEYAERRIREDGADKSEIVGIYEYENGSFEISDIGSDIVKITGRSGTAVVINEVQIESSTGGGQGDCMTFHEHGWVGFGTVWFQGKTRSRLYGLKIKRQPHSECDYNMKIVGITASWNPDAGYHLTRVQIHNINSPLEYQDDAGGITSGQTATFQLPYDITNPAVHQVTYIQWAELIAPNEFTISFIMEDGSSFTTTVDFFP